MTRAQRLHYFLAGLALATLAAALLEVDPAAAQTMARAENWSTTTEVEPYAGRSPVVRADDDFDRKPGSRRAFTGDDAPALRRTTIVEDGDDPAGQEPEPPRDGDLSEPASADPPPESGDASDDQRPEEDLAVFNSPPAGFDPLLFQIEDIDPIITDRRPLRLFRFEPYDPTGVRVGSFVFFPEFEAGVIATDNVLRSERGENDSGTRLAGSARLVSNWSVHALEFRATGLSTFHDDFPSEDDRAWSAEARGRVDILRGTNIEGLAARAVAQESRSAVDATRVGERPNITVDTVAVTANHRFNRLSLKLRGSLTEFDYGDVDNLGIATSNAERNYTEAEEALRATYMLKPTLSVFAEAETNQRDYDLAASSDGIRRSSDGIRLRGGLDFGGTGQILRGEVSLGYGRQAPDDGRLAAVDALLIDANLAYRFNELTTFLVTARTEIVDTTTAGSGGVVARQAGLAIRHAFRRYLIGTAGVTVTDNDFDLAPIEEQLVNATVGLEYYASPELILFGRYDHFDFASNEAGGDYDADEVSIGVRVRR